MPPTLKSAWKPDIMGRPLARSTITACTLIVTSTVPIVAPNANTLATSSVRLDASASMGSAAHRISTAAVRTVRQPNRAANEAANGIAAMEPRPRHSSTKPSVRSSAVTRALANGTKGAQADIAKPAMKNTTRVENCSAAPGADWASAPNLIAAAYDALFCTCSALSE
jgi:hypothetical protein